MRIKIWDTAQCSLVDKKSVLSIFRKEATEGGDKLFFLDVGTYLPNYSVILHHTQSRRIQVT
jgi:hypothetical protein